MGEAGLAQARRPVEQDMVDGFAPALGSGDGNLEVFLGLVLPDKVGQGTRPEAGIEGCVLFAGLPGYDASYGLTPSAKSKAIVIPAKAGIQVEGRSGSRLSSG
jgi:hypothetical protein